MPPPDCTAEENAHALALEALGTSAFLLAQAQDAYDTALAAANVTAAALAACRGGGSERRVPPQRGGKGRRSGK